MICVDQEGGRVQRFRNGFTQLPAMQAFSALLAKEEQQYWAQIAWLMASEMIAMDIDLSFAPVLDVGHQCKAIGDRSFHQDWRQLLLRSEAFVTVCCSRNGNDRQTFSGARTRYCRFAFGNTRDERPFAQIQQQDLQPFQQLIEKQKLNAIMPAHVIYTQADTQPASGSSFWLKQVLRQQLGFKGIIFLMI